MYHFDIEKDNNKGNIRRKKLAALSNEFDLSTYARVCLCETYTEAFWNTRYMCPYMYICIRMYTENERGAEREKELSEKESIIRENEEVDAGDAGGTGTEERGLKGVVATNSVTASPARPN